MFSTSTNYLEYMPMNQFDDSTLVPSPPSFETRKKHNQHNMEYWSARDLQPSLGYAEWRKFENTIKKAVFMLLNQRNLCF